MVARLGKPIGQGELRYLVALLASEQAEVSELSLELINMGVDRAVAYSAIKSLSEEGVIRAIVTENDATRHLDAFEMLSLAETVLDRREDQIELILTESGWARWEAEDWGISSNRAAEVFNSLVVARRSGGGPSLWARLRGWLGRDRR